jgi:ribosomal protein L28
MVHKLTARWRMIAVIVAALSLVVAAAALAAKPLAGKRYTGLTSGRSVNGWKPAVSFRVSSNRKQLRAFNWRGACRRIDSPPPPNTPPGWIDPGFKHNVGKVHVGNNGTFSVKNAKQRRDFGPHGSEVTISAVNGRFKTSKTAAGTIRFTTKDYSVKGALRGTCKSKVSFTAATR